MQFKAFREQSEVRFTSPLTVFVGPSGSGKTTILQCLHFLTQLTVAEFPDTQFKLSDVSDYLSIGDRKEKCQLSLAGNRLSRPEYSISISESNSDKIIGALLIDIDGCAHAWRHVCEFQDGDWHGKWEGNRFMIEDAPNFDSSAFIRFSAAKLKEPCVPSTPYPRVDRNGFGLASALKMIHDKHIDRFEAIVDSFRQIMPGVKRVDFEKLRVDLFITPIFGDSLVIEYERIGRIPAAHVSSGTMYTLGLLASILNPSAPSVILLDDIDRGLHPKAQMELIGLFRRILDNQADLQLIATSHSPYILDKLEWPEVRVTTSRSDGTAVCAPLKDHPKYPQWASEMSPGEFWSHVGEDWITERKPASTVGS